MNPQRDWHSEYERIGEKIHIGQPDPELHEGPASAGRIAVYVVGAIVILGIVLYGVNRPLPETAAVQQSTSSTASAPPAQSGGNAPATTGAAPQENRRSRRSRKRTSPRKVVRNLKKRSKRTGANNHRFARPWS